MKNILNKILSKSAYILTKYRPRNFQVFEEQLKLLDTNRNNIIFDIGAFDGKTSLRNGSIINH